MTAPVWFLAWVGFGLLFGILVAEVWIRLRDNYRRDGIDLDHMDGVGTRIVPVPPEEQVLELTREINGEQVVSRYRAVDVEQQP